jgi:formate-dependent nitrite reductase cytochrome c552 subunit
MWKLIAFVVCCFFVACEGPVGNVGLQGPQGPEGVQGQKGDKGESGASAALGSCMAPCHGDNGISGLSQFGISGHFLNGTEHLTDARYQDMWTNKDRSCGNCHAKDALAARLLIKDAVASPSTGQIGYWNSEQKSYTEANYEGSAGVGIISCRTCHKTTEHGNAPYIGGIWNSLFVGTSATIEKSPTYGKVTGTTVAFGKGNVCVSCHKSRKDITHYLKDKNEITSTHWGPHAGPQSDVVSGKGGYHLAGKTYSSSYHGKLKNGCVECHMPPVSANDSYPDHSFKAKVSACQKCHKDAKDFNFQDIQTDTEKLLIELQLLLNHRGMLTRGGSGNPILTEDELGDGFSLDESRPGVELSKDGAGILYNYFLIARGGAGGIHNPRYIRKLLSDGIAYLKE